MNRRGFVARVIGAIGVAAAGGVAGAAPKQAPAFPGPVSAAPGSGGEILVRAPRYGEMLRDGLKNAFEVEYRHHQYGYQMVVRGDSMFVERIEP